MISNHHILAAQAIWTGTRLDIHQARLEAAKGGNKTALALLLLSTISFVIVLIFSLPLLTEYSKKRVYIRTTFLLKCGAYVCFSVGKYASFISLPVVALAQISWFY